MFNFKKSDSLREISEANDLTDEEKQVTTDTGTFIKTEPEAKARSNTKVVHPKQQRNPNIRPSVASSKTMHITTVNYDSSNVDQNDFTALIQKQISQEVDLKVKEAVSKLEKRYASRNTFDDGGNALSHFVGKVNDFTSQRTFQIFPLMRGQEEMKEENHYSENEIIEEEEEHKDEVLKEKEQFDDEKEVEVVGAGEGNKAMYLDEDTYTMMMISPMDWSLPKCLCLTFVPCALLVGRGSWVFGLIPPFIELLLCGIIISDQTDFDVFSWMRSGTFPGSLNIPSETQSSPVYIAQFFSIILALMTQSDVLHAAHTLLLLRNRPQVPWQRTISRDGKEEIVGGFCTWVARVFIPVFLKFLQGIFVLFITWLIIVQSTNVVNLLKDYTALFVISSIDNIFYIVAENGYLGHYLAMRAQEAKGVKIYTDVSSSEARGNAAQLLLFALILFGMLGGWLATMILQIQGKTQNSRVWKLSDLSDTPGN